MRRFTETTIIAILSLTIIFHILILAGVIPPDIVWGSRLDSSKEVVWLETVSILLNVFFLVVILINAGVLKVKISPKVLNGLLWIMSVFFFLNTLGNLASGSAFEKTVFSPLTLILSTGFLILAMANKKKRSQAPV